MATPSFRDIERQMLAVSNLAIRNLAINAIRETEAGISEFMAAFADQLGEAVSGRRRLISAHQRIANAMQQAVVERYDQVVGTGINYRAGKGRLPGVLRNAVASGTNYQATRDGIGYIDRNFMDATAAHWRRINFGSEEGRGDGPRTIPVSLGQGVTFPMRLPEERGAAVLMPPGHWRGSEFYPARGAGPGSAVIPTQGIAATNFFDAGLEALAATLPEAYSDVALGWFQEATLRARGPAQRTRVVTPQSFV